MPLVVNNKWRIINGLNCPVCPASVLTPEKLSSKQSQMEYGLWVTLLLSTPTINIACDVYKKTTHAYN